MIILTSETITIDPGHNKSVIILVSNPKFRPRQIVIPHKVAHSFFLTEIEFGKRRQLFCLGAVPASLFASDASPKDFDFEPLRKDEDIKISASNISDKPMPFSVAMIGDYWDSGLRYEQKNTWPKKNFLGFGCTTIQASSTANIAVQPLLPFRGEHLIIPSSIAEHFTVSSIKCGAVEQTRLSSDVPAILFSEKGPQIAMRGLALDVVRSSMFLSIHVNNISKTVHNFSCAFTGTFTAP